jgi:hypothetical protein
MAKREWLAKEKVEGDKISVTLYNASEKVAYVLSGSFNQLPFAEQAPTVCFSINKQDADQTIALLSKVIYALRKATGDVKPKEATNDQANQDQPAQAKQEAVPAPVG